MFIFCYRMQENTTPTTPSHQPLPAPMTNFVYGTVAPNTTAPTPGVYHPLTAPGAPIPQQMEYYMQHVDRTRADILARNMHRNGIAYRIAMGDKLQGGPPRDPLRPVFVGVHLPNATLN